MGHIDLFKNIRIQLDCIQKKKTLKKQLHKSCKYERTMNVITQTLDLK